MALKLNNNTQGKKDALGFIPAELIPRFAKFTGRSERNPEAIERMVASLLKHGQEQPFTYRKSHDGYAIPVTGHTRILAADQINQRRLTDENGIQYGPNNPFVIYGIYRQLNELEAVIHTFVENDDDTRTPMNDLDFAFLIRTLGDNFGLTDADIAKKLGKPASWVSNHRKLLDLDPKTQKAVASGELAFQAALTVAKIDPEVREQVIEQAKQATGGKATAAAIANAARTADKAAPKLTRTDKDFKTWLRQAIEQTPVGKAQAFLFGILDYRNGQINEDDLNGLLATLVGEADEAPKRTKKNGTAAA